MPGPSEGPTPVPRHAEGPVPALSGRLRSSSAQCSPPCSTGARGLSTGSPFRRDGALVDHQPRRTLAACRRRPPPGVASAPPAHPLERLPQLMRHQRPNNPRVSRLSTPRGRPAVSDPYGAAHRSGAVPAPHATLRPPLRAAHSPPTRPVLPDRRRQEPVREPERRQRPPRPARRQSPERKRSPPSLRPSPTATHVPCPCCKSHITVAVTRAPNRRPALMPACGPHCRLPVAREPDCWSARPGGRR